MTGKVHARLRSNIYRMAAVCAALGGSAYGLAPAAAAEVSNGGAATGARVGNDRSIVRYFKVTVTSQGRIDSTWVGNEQAVQYEGTQSVNWAFETREIYEYGEYGGDDSIAYLTPACYGRRRSTCSKAKIKGDLGEDVNLVENPRTDPTPIACSRGAQTTKKRNDSGELAWAPSRGRSQSVGFAYTLFGSSPDESNWHRSVDADLRGHLPTPLKEPACPGPLHWISSLEGGSSYDPPVQCSVGGGPRKSPLLTEHAHEQLLFSPPTSKFRKSHSPFTARSACSQSLGLDHDSYASREHTTSWTSNWSVRFVPLKESKLEAAIKGLKNLR